MFGRQWLDQWAGAPLDGVKAEWRMALAQFDAQAIRQAVEHMRREGRDFPPNQTQFVALCRQFQPRGAHREVRALTDERRDPPPQGFQTIKDALKRAQVPRK